MDKYKNLAVKHNITTVSLYALIIFTIWSFVFMNSRIELLHDRCDYLEKQLDNKKEVVSNDYQSLIQLHKDNK